MIIPHLNANSFPRHRHGNAQFLSFLPLSLSGWPSCRQKTSCRSCWTKSRSSTRNSPSSILKFLPLSKGGAHHPQPQRTQPITIYVSLISAFSTTALVVSVMTHFGLYSSFTRTLVDGTQGTVFVLGKQNKTGDKYQGIEVRATCQLSTKKVAISNVVPVLKDVFTLSLCICRYEQ